MKTNCSISSYRHKAMGIFQLHGRFKSSIQATVLLFVICSVEAHVTGAVEVSRDVLKRVNEINEGWLEPLMDRIARNSTKVVCPVIDLIHEETFALEFDRKSVQVGGFDWGLQVNPSPITRPHPPSFPLHPPSSVPSISLSLSLLLLPWNSTLLRRWNPIITDRVSQHLSIAVIIWTGP